MLCLSPICHLRTCGFACTLLIKCWDCICPVFCHMQSFSQIANIVAALSSALLLCYHLVQDPLCFILSFQIFCFAAIIHINYRSTTLLKLFLPTTGSSASLLSFSSALQDLLLYCIFLINIEPAAILPITWWTCCCTLFWFIATFVITYWNFCFSVFSSNVAFLNFWISSQTCCLFSMQYYVDLFYFVFLAVCLHWA